MPVRRPLAERFREKVRIAGPDECWEWLGTITRYGYGVLESSGHQLRAHRISWMLLYGTIPHELCVLHRCDNRSCVNPDHLFLGTKSDNTHDMIAKGRQAPPRRGERSNLSKLTREDVLEIRRLYPTASGKSLANRFGVRRSHIYDIVSRRKWTWL